MRINRFYFAFDITKKEVRIEEEGLVNQIRNVLRMAVGDPIQLFNGQGQEAKSTIADFDKKSVTVSVEEVFDGLPSADNQAILYCAVLKKENFELVVQKATELGVAKIVPIITERTVKLGLNMERLHKIIIEACEQSGRGFLPEIVEPVDFTWVLSEAKNNDVNLFFHFSKTKISAGDKISGQVGLFVGPEGGWSDEEVDLAKESGCKIVSFGENVLRAETAAIIASYLGVK
ncbi:MAG: RsmE family RNA methyltransferase [bacterium]